ncbi:hypothetical protein LC612_35065 [Nostoc sp. CHAB 5834]|nr:hypothetical protein [Nostoc sp. CHAB 5834]
MVLLAGAALGSSARRVPKIGPLRTSRKSASRQQSGLAINQQKFAQRPWERLHPGTSIAVR